MHSFLPGKQIIRKALIHRLLLTAIFSIICLFIFSLDHRWVHLDEAWFADQAYQLLHDGYIRSEIFQGLLHYDVRVLDAHKLHIPHGALFIKLFGFSPYVVKAIPIPYVLLLL